MFLKIVHKGIFRNPPPGWCSLVTDLAGINLPNQADRKALQNPYCNAGKYHMHFNSADSFQNFFAGLFALHKFHRRRLALFLVIAQLRHMLRPEAVAESANLLLQFPERTFNPETIIVEPDNGRGSSVRLVLARMLWTLLISTSTNRSSWHSFCPHSRSVQ